MGSTSPRKRRFRKLFLYSNPQNEKERIEFIKNNPELFQKLLKYTFRGFDAIYYIVYDNHLDVLKCIIKSGIHFDINKKYYEYEVKCYATIIDYAIESCYRYNKNNGIKIIKVLLNELMYDNEKEYVKKTN